MKRKPITTIKEGHITYTIRADEFWQSAEITWNKYPHLGTDHMNYYAIGTHSSDHTQRPSFKRWERHITATLEACNKNFLGRVKTHANDTLARYESIDRARYHIPQTVLMTACEMIRKEHNRRIHHAKLGRKTALMQRLEPIWKETQKTFKEDFTFHDALAIYRNPPKRAIWTVSESNTHLYRPEYTETGSSEQLHPYGSKTRRFFFIMDLGSDQYSITEFKADEAPYYWTKLGEA